MAKRANEVPGEGLAAPAHKGQEQDDTPPGEPLTQGEVRRYKVYLTETITQSQVVEVEARTEEEAERLAEDLFDPDNLKDQRIEMTAIATLSADQTAEKAPAGNEIRPDDRALGKYRQGAWTLTLLERSAAGGHKEYLAHVAGPGDERGAVVGADTLREWRSREWAKYYPYLLKHPEDDEAGRQRPETAQEREAFGLCLFSEAAHLAVRDLNDGFDLKECLGHFEGFESLTHEEKQDRDIGIER